MPFSIIRDDLSRVQADAIVNPANPLPQIGAGTDWAIHEAAGPELLRARERIGELRPGEVAETPAFRLKARYVIHASSPVWEGGAQGEEALLRRAYDAALALADRLGCRSVAFPLLAAGSYGFPRELALTTAIRAFTDFLLEHDMQIDLVLFNGSAFALAGSLFDDLKSYIDDNYVSAKRAMERATENRENRDYRRPPRRTQYPQASQAETIAEESGFPGDMPMMAPSAFAGSLEELFGQRESSFTEHLLSLLAERDGKDSEVYRRAEISRQLFSKILNNPHYQPTKSTAIQLAIGLQLDLTQTQRLLEKAGYALTRSSKADLVVQYYIERKIYSVSFINAALDDCGLPPLKTGLKA